MMMQKFSFLFVALALFVFSLPHTAFAFGPYVSSNIGYDLSFNTKAYPADGFNFGIVSVTRGKAFTRNSRFPSEYSWTQLGTTGPTFYMNLNAPYGKTVAGHIGTPKTCASRASSSTEPTACEGYNYGYNAARDAYEYTKSVSATAPLWWLDIEEANSWSPTRAVNDATIQGAIDYLNTQGIRVGMYSTRLMWRDIAGSTFVPTQTINGQAVSIPNWFPIGVSTQIGALNTCQKSPGFMTGSPVWLIQYEVSATAIDQNIAC